MEIFGYKIPRITIIVFIVIAIILMIILSNLITKLTVREPAWVIERNQLANEEKTRLTNWQTYTNNEYGFSLENPPMTKVDDCKISDCNLSVVFGTENFIEIAGIKNSQGPTKKYFMGIMVKTLPTNTILIDYVENQKKIISEVSLINRKALGLDLNINWVIKKTDIDNTQVYVIETINHNGNTPSRHFFIPLKNNQILIIFEVGRNIDDILSTIKVF